MSEKTPCPVATIFAREVRAGYEPDYERWLTGISKATSEFPGNYGTTILRPAEERDEYIAITHFDSAEHMRGWLDSDGRARWLAQLENITIDREQIQSLAGMERWFMLPYRGKVHPPPRYKSAVLVLLGLYPVVLLLGFFLNPLLSGLPAALQLLLSLTCSVALMAWVVSPMLTWIFAGWLHPRRVAPNGPATTTS